MGELTLNLALQPQNEGSCKIIVKRLEYEQKDKKQLIKCSFETCECWSFQ
jgi:hypothetical protein